MNLFDRAAAADAQILKVERLGGPNGASASGSAAFLMTFDVGRILVNADPIGARLDASTLDDEKPAPGGMSDASEDEPWWRLLGSALASAASESPDRLRLDFRISGGRVRALVLERVGGSLTATLSDQA